MSEDEFLIGKGWHKLNVADWWAKINERGTLAMFKSGALRHEGYKASEVVKRKRKVK